MGYKVSRANTTSSYGSLVDRVANGGFSGCDVRIISKTDRSVDVTGIDNHEMGIFPIVTEGGVVISDKGDVVSILHQYAYDPSRKSIH